MQDRFAVLFLLSSSESAFLGMLFFLSPTKHMVVVDIPDNMGVLEDWHRK